MSSNACNSIPGAGLRQLGRQVQNAGTGLRNSMIRKSSNIGQFSRPWYRLMYSRLIGSTPAITASRACASSKVG